MTRNSPRALRASFAIAFLCLLFHGRAALAQIVPDATLPNPSAVDPNGNTFAIDGGTAAGANLFHSFSEFSVPAGTEAFFNNAPGIENIITRVTGGNISKIDGAIGANGLANLFLLNPNGIVFGSEARLAIGGSFYGSTADRLQFADGLVFGATVGTQAPLLSVNVPVGLQFGSNPGSIRVRGTFQDTFELPTRASSAAEADDLTSAVIFNSLNRPIDLAVAPGKTLALAGGDITVEGAQLFAPEGRIVLGSVGPGSVVGIEPTGDLTYDRVSNFRDVRLDRSATVNASGNGGGRLQLRGRSIRLTDNSVAIALNTGDGENAASGIDVRADEFVLQQEAGLVSLAIGSGAAGDANLQVRTLTLSDRTILATATFGAGDAGRIAIRAADAVSVTDTSLIAASSVGAGAGGPIEIETRRLILGNAGEISSSADGLGRGGDLHIHASESIALNPGPGRASENESGALSRNGLFSTTASVADAGEIVITTDRLTLNASETAVPTDRPVAFISSRTTAEGKAGTIAIRANSLEAIGSPRRGGIARISSQGGETASGSAGSVTLIANDVAIRDGAQLLVSNFGSADAGTLSVAADILTLADGGEIAASTVSGGGGSVTLETGTLVLYRGGRIATDAGSTDGGNITIDTGVLAAIANSDITANAEGGFGGQVVVEADRYLRHGISRATYAPKRYHRHVGFRCFVRRHGRDRRAGSRSPAPLSSIYPLP